MEGIVDKAFVAQRVATKLFATEKAIDQAMVEAAELMTSMVKARQDLQVSAVFGDQAQAKVVEALSALAAARTSMVEMHAEMAEMKLRLGMRTTLVGIEDKPPEQKKTKGHLSEVA